MQESICICIKIIFESFLFIIIIIIIIPYLLSAIELSLGGSSPYTSTGKTNKNKMCLFSWRYSPLVVFSTAP